MRVFEYEGNKVIDKEYLYKALNLDLSGKYVISFVGGGGKTSSIYKLSCELAILGKKVIVTTTTHMQMPKDKVVLNDNIDEINDILEKNNFVTVGIKAKGDKITSVSEEGVRELSKICDFLLIEADGAKMLPLKAPEDHEPVILSITNMVVGICGIDALGKKINETCHRANIVSKLLNKEISSIIDTDDISYILSSKDGTMKNVNKDIMEYRVIINKVDDGNLLDKAVVIVKKLKNKNIKAIMTSYY